MRPCVSSFLLTHSLLFERIDIHQFVDDRVDSQTGRRVDIEFAGDVLAMGDNGVSRDKEHVCDLFVAQTTYHLYEHIFLAVGQFLGLLLLVPTMAVRLLFGERRT